jgi:hypothetical protein
LELGFGDVAQLAERLICIQEVAGSTPVISTIFNLRFQIGNFKVVKDKNLNPSA